MTPDVIDQTATQVRLPGCETVHELADSPTSSTGTRFHRTRCGRSAPAHLAVLTTRPATCSGCDRSEILTIARRRKLALL